MYFLRASVLLPFLMVLSPLLQATPAVGFSETPNITLEPDFCSLYPMALPAELLVNAQPGNDYSVALGTGPGNYNWVSWNGTNDANSVAARLLPPGNSDTYINPHRRSDRQLNVGDWVEGAAGVKNAKSVRDGMNTLLNTFIILPVFSDIEGNGANLNYHISAFAVVQMRGYKLNGKGYLNFTFERFTRCYNNRPVALDFTVEVNEDEAINFTLPTADGDADGLTLSDHSNVEHGLLAIDVQSLLANYAPAADFNGTDAFEFQVHDDEQLSNLATVTIIIRPINDAPIAEPANGVGLEDTLIPLNFIGHDIDSIDLTFVPTLGGEQGGIVDQDGVFYYQPNANYNGQVTLSYKAFDAVLYSNSAPYRVSVLPVNDEPVVSNAALELEENRSVRFTPVVADIDSNSYSLLTHTAPEHGSISIDGRDVLYTPNVGFVGEDLWLFQADDQASGPNDVGTQLSNIGEVKFTVIKVNEPPVITSAAIEFTDEFTEYAYPIVAHDPNERDVLSYFLEQMPQGMAINGTTGDISWVPDASWTQSVPDFNKQCYVVPSGSAKVYEEGDENSGLAYVAPLFQQVTGALESASAFTAQAAVTWHKTNECLGCHVQTQSLLGLQAAKDKADVDEDSAEYLLTELLRSQQSDGSVRRSHPEYAKTQTAFALWSLSFVPEFERTLTVRGRALNFMMARQNTNGDQLFWSQDHSSGWMRDYDSITSVVTLGGARYLKDLLKLKTVTAEQQGYADSFTARIDSIVNFELARAYGTETETLWLAFRQIALAELLPLVADEQRSQAMQNAIDFIDAQLRSRQLATGGWSRYSFNANTDPLTSAWVGLALNYLDPPLTDAAVIANIEYLLNSQAANGTWVTSSGLFTTHLATTSLVMAYLPVALEHLGNPDVYAGTIQLTEGTSGVHTLRANISNRGLADITAPVTVEFFNGSEADGVLLGSVELTGLLSGETKQPTLEVEDSRLTDHVYISLVSTDAADECDITNNASHAALVRVKVTDPSDASDTQVYTLNVQDVNEVPAIISDAPTEHQGGQGLQYQIQIADNDVGDGHIYTIISGPANVYIDASTGLVTAAPSTLAPGTYTIVVQVEDLRGAFTTQTITITVYANEAPTIVSVALTFGDEVAGYRYDVDATDPNEGDVLEYGLELFPSLASIAKDNGLIDWVGHRSIIENILATNLMCVGSPNADSSVFDVVEKFRWTAAASPYASSNQVMMAPIVVPLSDTNNDGVVSSDDEKVILFSTFTGSRYNEPGHLRAISASTGAHLWTTDASIEVIAVGSIAAADIDMDGFPEIIVPKYQGGFHVIDHNGALKWSSSTPVLANWGGASIADINGDGLPEIIMGRSVFDANGNVLWSISPDSNGGGVGPLSFAADINLDGYQEIIDGARVYSHSGELLWSADDGSATSGYSAVANLDDDDDAEVIVVRSGTVQVYQHDGAPMWPAAVAIPGGGNGGPPTIADFDGDGIAEIGVAGANRYVALTRLGSILWQSPTRDNSSNRTGSSVFDFNGDGRAEVVYADELYLRVYDGPTGDILFEQANPSGTTYELPVIADVDGDNHAEIVVIGNNYSFRGFSGVRVFEAANDDWAPTRAIWNQHAYSINNIYDDLTVPAQPVKSWLTHNTFRLNTFADRPALGLADLTVHNIGYNADTQSITATVLNRGLAPVTESIDVNIFHDHAWTGKTLLGTVTLDRLANGASTEVSLAVDDPALLEQTLLVELALPDTVKECITNNNSARAVMMQASVYDPAGASDRQTFAVSIKNQNDAPVIASSASSTMTQLSQGAQGDVYTHRVEVIDLDVGDAFRFELLDDAPAGLTIGEFSGIIETDSSVDTLALGGYPFTIRAYDLAGAYAEQAHLLTVTLADNFVPVISSTAPESVLLGDQYRYPVIAADPDGDAIQFFMSRTQPGLSIDADTGLILWIPSATNVGLKTAEVSVIDANGAISKQYFLIDVIEPTLINAAPVITSVPSGVVYAGKVYGYQVMASDVDGDELAYSVVADISEIAIDSQGLLTWLPRQDLVGRAIVVSVQVDDGRGGIARQQLTLPVNASANHPPIISSTPTLASYVDRPYQYTLIASDEDGDRFSFELLDKANGMTLVDSQGDKQIQWTPSPVQVDSTQNVTVKVTDARGAASTQTFSVYVNALVTANAPPVITSVPTSSVYANRVYHYAVVATDADNDILTYSLSTTRNDVSIDGSTGLLTWLPTDGDIGETIALSVQVKDGSGGLAWQNLLLPVNDIANQAPVIRSVPGIVSFVDAAYHYQIVASDEDGDAFSLTLLEAPEGMSLADDRIQWTPSSAQAGRAHQVTLKAEDARGAASTQSFSVYVNEVITANTAPDILSVPSSPAIIGREYGYDIMAVDPDGDTLTYSLGSTLTGLTLSNSPTDAGALRWTPTIDQLGTHTLDVRVSDGRATATQTFLLDVIEAPVIDDNGNQNQAPQITSRPRTETVQNQQYQYQLIATDADDDILNHGSLILPEGATYNDGLFSWTPTPAQIGIHDVVLFVDDSQIRALQSYSIAVFDEALPIDVFLNVEPRNPEFGDLVTVQLLANGGQADLVKSVTVNGTEYVLDAYGSTTVLANQYGVNDVVGQVTDGVETVSEADFFSVVDPLDVTPPSVTIAQPLADSSVTEPTNVVATVFDANLRQWRLIYKEMGSKPTAYIVFAEGNGNVDNQVLAQFDPTLMNNGLYDIILEAEDTNGQKTTDSVGIIVEGDMKLGHFTMSFEDISVDLAGIPISVTRTYDTRQRDEDLDFGKGWSIDYQNVRVQESRTLGFSWSLNYYKSGFFGEYCVEPNGDPIVSIRLPGGDIEKFRAKAIPECTSIVPTVDVQLGFEPIGDTRSTLEQTSYGLLRIASGNIIELGGEIGPVDPDTYKLTTQDGMVYALDQQFGLRKVNEPGGHSISYSDDGIAHSLGYAIDFERDAYNRITALILPDGRRVGYAYDVKGDLTKVTDLGQENTMLTYVPKAAHYLDEIYDPRGVRATKMVYDDQGRLKKIIDADGNVMAYEHDLTGQVEVVRDRNGNPTTYLYDNQGRVLVETNAEGDSITRTYSQYGDVLTETNELGETTEWTYNAQGFQTSETNAAGQTTSWTYTSNGEMLTETNDRNEVVMINVYNSQALKLSSTTDALGNKTQFHWDVGLSAPCGTSANLGYTDAKGNRTKVEPICFGPLAGKTGAEIDALGNVTRYSYDSAGRKLTTTTSRVDASGDTVDLVTAMEYDDQDRVTKVTYPDGTFSITNYNSIGKVAAQTDIAGRRTEYVYNNRGEEIEVHYPDGTSSSTIYDANGNVIAETDIAGQTTQMVYDSLNRVVATIYPDGTPFDDSDNPRTSSEYNAAGRLVVSIDVNGKRTAYDYDVSGRRTRILDTLLNETRFEYDDLGRKVATVDANAHRTTFVYDALDRVIETHYHDGSQTQVSYDALGRKTSETDELGRTTQFEYDAKGQLTKVIDPYLNETTYTYNEQGSKLTQTDAELNTTTWTYDNQGRVVTRTLPEGEVEVFTYNTLGQLSEQTDFNGQTTYFEYDDNGRQTLKDNPLDADVSTTYNATGLTDTLTDGNGTAQYSYDAQYRLNRIDYPTGAYVEYAYDLSGNRTLVRSAHSDTTYSYDSLNRLKTVTDANGTTEYGYTKVGSRASIDYPNGVTTSYEYDSRNRLTRIDTEDALGLPLLGISYTLNLNGTRKTVTEDSGRTTTYDYDDLDRLTSEVVTDATAGNRSTSWTYNKTANRLSQMQTDINGTNTTTYVYDNNDRLTSEFDRTGATTHIYDANGNTTQTLSPTDVVDYQWNDDNRLTHTENNAGDITTYNYDVLGIRQSKTNNGTTTYYLVDPNTSYADVIAEEDDNGQLITTYTHGDDLISQTRSGLNEAKVSFYHADGLGSARLLTNPSGTATDSYQYQAFGELESQEGTTDNNYLFTGEQYDPNLGFYYLRARYMNPASGRFVSQDSWMGRSFDPVSLHKYAYANGDGVNMLDPSGYMSMGSLSAGSAVGGILSSITISIPSIVSSAAVGVAGTAGAVGIVASVEYLLGFPSTTRKVEHEINSEAMRLAASAAAVSAVASERPIGHHSIPVYMCGAAEAGRQQLVPLKPSVHVPLHSAMVIYSSTINSAYRRAFSGSNKVFSYSNKEPLQLLAQTAKGRSVITKHLDIFYNFGWFELGAPYFRGIFQQESQKYIGGVTSLPNCRR